VNIDDLEQVRTRWGNGGTPERAEVLIPGHGSGDSLVFVQVKGGQQRNSSTHIQNRDRKIITY
jgi:hypothetical protein